ncbi:MAG: DNA-directed RNA polymerase, partial [Plesiomonas sp.]
MFTMPKQAATFLAGLIWDAVGVTVIAAVQAMEWLQKAANLVSSKVVDKKTKEVLKPSMPVFWVTPNGMPIWSEYRERNEKRIEATIMGQMFFCTLAVGDKKEIDVKSQTSGIAPNFVHSMDASHLQLTAVWCNEQYGITDFAMIHDSFGCHAGKATLLFRGVRETMVNTYTEHDVIAEFYEQFKDQLHESQWEKMPDVPAKGKLDIQEVLKSLYTFS